GIGATTVRGCQCYANSGNPGIVLSTGVINCRVEGNNLTNNGTGIRIVSAGNIVVRNTCSDNTTNNWDIAIGNAVAPIVQASTNGAAITGNTYAGSLGST